MSIKFKVGDYITRAIPRVDGTTGTVLVTYLERAEGVYGYYMFERGRYPERGHISHVDKFYRLALKAEIVIYG